MHKIWPRKFAKDWIPNNSIALDFLNGSLRASVFFVPSLCKDFTMGLRAFRFCVLCWGVGCFLLGPEKAQAQNKVVRWGYLRDSVTKEPIALAAVANLSNQQTVMSSTAGRFKLSNANPGQILSFAAVGYYFDTLVLRTGNPNDTLVFYLRPLATNLGNVTVTGKLLSRYQQDSIERSREFKEKMVSPPIPTFGLSNSGAGLGIGLEGLYKKERNKRKGIDFFKTNEEEEYINYRFSPELVVKYTGFQEDELQAFMQAYRPTYKWLRQHPKEEDLLYYINESLFQYKQGKKK